jgi:translation initiation factor IF-3
MEDLIQISSILKTPLLKMNHEIGENIMVRVIDDDSGKYVGTMKIEEAIGFGQKMNKDLILHNSKVQPMLCKLLNYRGHLYSRFVKEVLKEDIMLKKSYEKKKELLVEDVKLRLNITQHDLKNKLAKYFKKKQRLKGINIRMSIKGHDIDKAMAVFGMFQTEGKHFLKATSKVNLGKVDDSELADEDDMEEYEKDEENTEGNMVSRDESHKDKEDFLNLRKVNREGKYVLRQSFELIGVERKTVNTYDAEFTDKELEDIVRDYFNFSRRGLQSSREEVQTQAKKVDSSYKTQREKALEEEINKQKSIKLGKEAMNPTKYFDEDFEPDFEKLQIKGSNKEKVKVFGIQAKEPSKYDILYEELREKYRKNYGMEECDDEVKFFLDKAASKNLETLKGYLK